MFFLRTLLASYLALAIAVSPGFCCCAIGAIAEKVEKAAQGHFPRQNAARCACCLPGGQSGKQGCKEHGRQGKHEKCSCRSEHSMIGKGPTEKLGASGQELLIQIPGDPFALLPFAVPEAGDGEQSLAAAGLDSIYPCGKAILRACQVLRC